MRNIYRDRIIWLGVFVWTCLVASVPVSAEEQSLTPVAPAVLPPTWPEPLRKQHAEMKRRVDAWLAKGEQSEMPLHVVYLTCNDQEPFAEHRLRLNRVLTEIQDWFAIQHQAAGFGRTTFALQRDDDNQVVIHEGKIPFELKSRNLKNIPETTHACRVEAKKLLAAANVNYDRSFVLVLTTLPDDPKAAPYFGNIIQDRGYCFAVDTPWLDLNYKQTEGPKVWKGNRIGKSNSALIGGIAHELGHGFGLPHSDEPKELKPFGESLMGSGNYTWRQEVRGEGRGSFLLATDAMFLIARPPFNDRTREFNKQPQVKLANFDILALDDGTIKVSGKVTSDIPIYAVKMFDDAPGNLDYNQIAHATLPDEETGQFSIAFRPQKNVGVHQLKLVMMHVNGRWNQINSTMQVDAEGKADLSTAKSDFAKAAAR